MELSSKKSGALKGAIEVPGDKSISHRALIISSQATGTSKVTGLLEGEDVLATAEALRNLGVEIEKKNDEYHIKGVGIGGLQESAKLLDMGNSGTGVRLLMGLVASYNFNSFFTGDKSLCGRPMGRVTKPLEQMGVNFITRENGRLPLALKGLSPAIPIEYELPVASAQVKSAILLAGLNTPGKTSVIENEPTRDHTELMLKFFGADIVVKGKKITLKGHPNLKAKKLIVPADPSSAAFPAAAALIVSGSDITIKNVCINPLRIGFYKTLKEMGAKISYKNKRNECGEQVADINIKYSKLKGVEVPAERAPSMIDEYPILAVLAAYATGKTVMKGLKELRVKESDRLQTIYDGLKANGVKAKMTADSLTVEGGKVKGGGLVATHLDHRIAMSFLVMGLGAENPVKVDDGSPINTSFPGFVNLMRGLGAEVSLARAKPLVIAVDGPAASGKGTLSRRIAEMIGAPFLDTGRIYRAVGLKLIYNNKDPKNEQEAIAAARELKAEDLTNPRLRQEVVGQAASIISSYPEVRKILLDFQRDFAKRKEGAVLDGRDIGTVVCPNADLKIFVTAGVEARARRRYRELMGQGVEVAYNSVLDDLNERDERDSKRDVAPLEAAKDAVVIDTTDMSAEEVYLKVRDLVNRLL